jgi:hypothetical protein
MRRSIPCILLDLIHEETINAITAIDPIPSHDGPARSDLPSAYVETAETNSLALGSAESWNEEVSPQTTTLPFPERASAISTTPLHRSGHACL